MDYADASDGLYPAGNQIGRTQFRIDHANAGNLLGTRNHAGSWLTANNWVAGTYQTGSPNPIVGAAGTGWCHWLDFIVDEDMFLITEGFNAFDVAPTISEISLNLSGVQLPIMNIEEIYASEEETNKGYLEVPVVISPKSQYIIDIRSQAGVRASNVYDITQTVFEHFQIIGESIGKRSVLIRQIY